MKNLKNLLAAVTLMAVLMIGASTAKAGLLVSDFTGSAPETPCTETNDDTKLDWGVIVNGATGVIVNGFTGLLVSDFTGVIVVGATDPDENCGVIVNG